MGIFFDSLCLVISPMGILINVTGVILGIIFGALPGLNGVVGVALLLPVTYGMPPAYGLIMLGGLFGVVIMGVFTPALSKLALKFGPPELFLVCMAGLAVVGSLMGKSIGKGFFSVAFGLALSIVGMDTISCNYRFTFDNFNLQSGLSLIPVSVGFFAIAEMLNMLYNTADNGVVESSKESYRIGACMKELALRWKLVLKSSVIGTIIGILPGTGGAIASFIAYGEAKRSSREPHLFGKGSIDGIIAPESANNAAVGGSFVPLLSLGIPGSATSALIFGTLTVHGLIPGPKLFSEHADMVYALIIGLFFSIVVMVVIGLGGISAFSKILKIKTTYIIPAVLAFSVIGAYSARNNLFDVLVAVVFGFIGFVFKRNQIPIAPSVLGMILGAMAEQNLRRTLTIAGAKEVNIFSYILLRPISVVILILLALLIYGNMKTALRSEAE